MTKKELLTETAIHLFVAKGFDHVSTAEIAKASGVANGTLFNYFTTKEALIVACYQEAKRSFIAQTIPHLAKDSAKETMRSMWSALIVWSLANQDWFHYLQQFRHSAYYRNDLLQEDDGWQALLAWWRKAIADKVIEDVPLGLLLSLFTGLLYSTIDYQIQHQDEPVIEPSFALCWSMIHCKQDDVC